MAALQTWYGLGPLRGVRRAIQRMRTTGANRVTDPLPLEVQPLVQELNALLAHTEKQAEEARTHAGNLAHALKTPLTVVMNAATAKAPDLADTVIREAAVMRRQVDHHLARARAVGRRAVGQARAQVGESVEAVLRAVTGSTRRPASISTATATRMVAIERQDLDEILGNLIENAAKYGGGSVFVTIDADSRSAVRARSGSRMTAPASPRRNACGSSTAARGSIPASRAPGWAWRSSATWRRFMAAGSLDESEDLGGLLVKLRLPRAGR